MGLGLAWLIGTGDRNLFRLGIRVVKERNESKLINQS